MNSLDLLTARLFDYAGTFAPASLPMKEALAESARAPLLARPAMLATDIVVDSPDLRLVTAKNLEAAGFADTQCAIALVGIDAGALKRSIDRVKKFNEKNVGVAGITSMEVHGKKFESKSLQAASDALGGVRLVIEPQITDRAWAASGSGLIAMLGRLRVAGAPITLKIRGAGPHAVSNRTLAALIPQVVAAGVPLKATAGMHHPILEAEYRNAVGFINLAAALRLHQGLGAGFDAEAILGCLYEQAPDAFSFDGELAWRAHAMTHEQLGQAMDDLSFTIGTCSLREPDNDLVRLFGPP